MVPRWYGPVWYDSLYCVAVAAMPTGTLRLQVGCQLLLHNDLLRGFEDGFTFGESQTPVW